MPTTVTSSIGSSGRDYSTLQAWEDAAPADLVSDDKIWKGEAYNDSEFLSSSGNNISFAGSTTDATRYKFLTAAAGQSFQDHADVRTNALRYNQSNGVGIRNTATYDGCIGLTEDYVRLSRLQVKQTVTGKCLTGSGRVGVLRDLILHATNDAPVGWESSFGGLWVNVIAITDTSTGNAAFRIGGGLTPNTFIGCLALRPTDRTAGGTGWTALYGNNNALYSCGCFGYTTFTAATTGGGATWTGSHNATDVSSGAPGSSNQHSVSYTQTTPFTDADKDSLDLRAVASTALAGNGLYDGTNAPNDISNLARADPPTIGAWELAVAGVTLSPGEGALAFGLQTPTLMVLAPASTTDGRIVFAPVGFA